MVKKWGDLNFFTLLKHVLNKQRFFKRYNNNNYEQNKLKVDIQEQRYTKLIRTLKKGRKYG